MVRITAPSIQLEHSAFLAIAVGCALTTRQTNFEPRISHKIKASDPDCMKDSQCSIRRLPFFTDLLPSFCDTASNGYRYHFYISYDFDDPHLANATGAEIFRDTFDSRHFKRCPHISMALHLVRLPHSRQPARAQNDAMMAAYKDNMTTYYFRLNDDTTLETKNWTEAFIATLSSLDPPNVGVVAPSTEGDINRKHSDL